jgi:hypothetical protein
LTALVLIMTGLKVTLDLGPSSVLPVLTGGVSRDEYLADSLGWYYEAVKTINQLEPDATTLFLWEPRALYCRITCLPDAMLDRFVYARRTLGTPHALAEAWRAQGVDYLLIWNAGYQAARQLALNRIAAEDEQALQQLIHEELDLVKDYGGAYQLYRLRPS